MKAIFNLTEVRAAIAVVGVLVVAGLHSQNDSIATDGLGTDGWFSCAGEAYLGCTLSRAAIAVGEITIITAFTGV